MKEFSVSLSPLGSFELGWTGLRLGLPREFGDFGVWKQGLTIMNQLSISLPSSQVYILNFKAFMRIMSGLPSTANRKRSQIYSSMLEVMPGTFGTLLRGMETMRSVNLQLPSLINGTTMLSW